MLPIKYPHLLGILFTSMIISNAWSATLDSITQTEIVQSKQLKKHLEVLKGHLEDTIKKLEHNIKARQTQFRIEALTPDSGKYIEVANSKFVQFYRNEFWKKSMILIYTHKHKYIVVHFKFCIVLEMK